MTKEELLREEIKRLQQKQRIFWTSSRKEEIEQLWREIESDKKAN